MKPYPPINEASIRNISEYIRTIAQLRQDDVSEIRNLNTRFVSGRLRTDRTAPTAPTDVQIPDRENDVVRTSAGDYVLVNVSGTLRWLFSPFAGGTIFAQTADKTVANTNSETTLLTTGTGSLTLPANSFVAGRTLRVTLAGYYSTTSTPTIRIRVKLGSTTVFDTSTYTTSTVTSRLWRTEALLTCRTTGASGTAHGTAQSIFATSATAAAIVEMPRTSTVTLDTTGTLAFDATVTWGSASSSNTITCTEAILEFIN